MIRPYYLLDTNIVSEIMKANPDSTVCKNIAEHEKLCAISSTTWNELLFGVQTMATSKKKDLIFDELINEIQSNYEIIQYDNHAAWIHADIRARLKDLGNPLDFQDTQIASIAVSNCMVLVTRNVKHFEAIQQFSPLMLENWFE